MHLNDLIAKLTELQRQHGNIPVLVNCEAIVEVVHCGPLPGGGEGEEECIMIGTI